MAQKMSNWEKAVGGSIIGTSILVVLVVTGIVGVPGSGTGAFGGGDVAQAPTDTVITGATSASLELTAKDYDRPASDPNAQFSTTTTVNASVLKKSNNAINEQYTSFSIGTETNPVIQRGVEYIVVPVDSSYAVLESEISTVNADRDPHEVDIIVHAIATEANMNFNCYDVDTGSELDAGSNTSMFSYNLTLSANEDDIKTRCKIEVGASNVAYPLGAIATISQNDIEDFPPTTIEYGGSSYGVKEVSVPKHMDSLTFSTVVLGSQWENVYLIENGPIMLYGDGSSSEGVNLKKAWVEFKVDTSGTDPTHATDTTADMMCAIIKDIEPYISIDGSPSFGFHDDTDTKADVGLDESDDMVPFSTFSKNTGVCIDAL